MLVVQSGRVGATVSVGDEVVLGGCSSMEDIRLYETGGHAAGGEPPYVAIQGEDFLPFGSPVRVVGFTRESVPVD